LIPKRSLNLAKPTPTETLSDPSSTLLFLLPDPDPRLAVNQVLPHHRLRLAALILVKEAETTAAQRHQVESFFFFVIDIMAI
jgi:hypothetical protein